MKALIYGGPKTLHFREVERPTPQENEVLINIKAVGICGSDMHAYLGHDARRPAPLILGHEAAGIVESGPQKGQRVTINPLVSCLDCAACRAGRENICADRQIISMPPRDGAFAQFICIPKRNIVAVPDEVPLEKAALVEPLAVSWHTVNLVLNSLHHSMPKSALVIGGGAIGVAAVLALNALRVSDITLIEPNESRRKFVAKHVPARTLGHTNDMFSIVIDAVGISQTRQVASALVSAGGVIGHVGLGDNQDGLDIRRMTLQEITLIGSYTYTAQEFYDTAEALFSGQLGDLNWTEMRPLSAGMKTFDDLYHHRVFSPKIVLNPWQ